MTRTALLLLTLLGAQGCIGYPRPFFTRVKGQAAIDDGKPIRIQAAIVKNCDTTRGESEKVKRMHETTTDAQGRYSMIVWGVSWNFKNFVTLSECKSQVQRWICRQYCKKADAVDIDLLGK